ncbi:SDR family NAD(P)-dependent oxidoreductase [Zavarzinia sp. CC-PAN008]|uniref:SDR family NAD(P)-dependent oxidoreductase n=1 Tax=Zavarzinia sp. CC-PAN008 TaxID=3243332 RepID=UPI003F749C67
MSAHLFDLTGRVALVTGAGSGIGRAATATLAGLGAIVVATDRNLASVEETVASLDQGSALAVQQDVTEEAGWPGVLETVRSRYGRLDILLNNAGIMLAKPFLETPLEALRRQYAINVEGPFMGMQAAIPLMTETAAAHGTGPSIINVSSIYGQIVGDRYSAYSASKGAIKMLSKAVAAELAPAGIRVNSIHPGPTATNLGAEHEAPKDATGRVLSPEEIVGDWLRRIPMGRFGAADDIAAVIAFLACDASRYVTGAEIVVDGGYSAI